MRAFIVVAALAGLSAAQLPVLPDCAKDCVIKFTSGSNIGGCSSLDAACICRDQGFLSGIACCLKGACNDADQAQAVDYAIKFCSSLGVVVPTAVTCTSSLPASTQASTASSTAPPATTSPAPASTTTASVNAAAHQAVGAGAGLVGWIAAAVAML